MKTTGATQSILPSPVPDTGVLHLRPRDAQLPSKLRMPSRELLGLFKKLGRQLGSKRRLALEKPSVALTVSKVRGGGFLVEWDIPRDLTDDSDLRDDLHSAMATFIECSCPGATMTRPPVTGNVGSILVKIHTDEEVKSLDTALFSVTRIARLLQVADGGLKRLPGILRDPALGAGLMKLVGAYHFDRLPDLDGLPGKLVMRPTAGHISAEESAMLAKQLADAGHVDLALIVLTGALKNGSPTEKVELAPAYLSYLMKHDLLLDNEQDFNTAFGLIVNLLREADRGHKNSLVATCYPVVHYLLDGKMFDKAFELVTEMSCLPFEKEAHQQAYVAVMQRFVRDQTLSTALAEKVYQELDNEFTPFTSNLAQELAGNLSDMKGMDAVFESPLRETLEKLGFTFKIDGHLVVRSDDIFIPAKHGEAMLEYAQSLVQNVKDPGSLRGFCWPLLHFLMAHRAELPPAVLQGVLVLSVTVVAAMTERSLTSPILTGPVLPTIELMQQFIEAALLQSAINGLPTPESSLAPTSKRLLALFNGGALSGKPALLEALLQCWKTLTKASDVECLTLRLRNTRAISPDAAVKFAQEARLQLKECLASQNPDIDAALELHAELVDFIVSAARGREGVAWATQLLAEMSSEALSSSLCQVQPNAAAWPTAGSIKILINTGELSSDECLLMLRNCAALPGVTVDRRLSAMFRQAINFGYDTSGSFKALDAFMIRESLPFVVSAQQERVGVRMLGRLIEAVRIDLVLARGAPREDLQKAVSTLFTEALAQDPEAALGFLEGFLADSRTYAQHYPWLLGTVFKLFVDFHLAQNDITAARRMEARALMDMSSNQSRPPVMSELPRYAHDI